MLKSERGESSPIHYDIDLVNLCWLENLSLYPALFIISYHNKKAIRRSPVTPEYEKVKIVKGAAV